MQRRVSKLQGNTDGMSWRRRWRGILGKLVNKMSAPVRHTCPDIDKVIKAIKTALSLSQDGKREVGRDNDLYIIFDGIEDELYGLSDNLEYLRSSNNALRNWGYELEKEIENLEAQIE